MRSQDKDKDILKGIIKQGIHSPDNNYFNQEVLDRLSQEKEKGQVKDRITITPLAIVLMVFSFIFIFTSLMTPVIGKLAEWTGLHLIRLMEETMTELPGLIFHSPTFVLVFGVMILLYQLDRYLNKQTYSSG